MLRKNSWCWAEAHRTKGGYEIHKKIEMMGVDGRPKFFIWTPSSVPSSGSQDLLILFWCTLYDSSNTWYLYNICLNMTKFGSAFVPVWSNFSPTFARKHPGLSSCIHYPPTKNPYKGHWTGTTSNTFRRGETPGRWYREAGKPGSRRSKYFITTRTSGAPNIKAYVQGLYRCIMWYLFIVYSHGIFANTI